MLEKAASGGANYVQTPEMSLFLEQDPQRMFANSHPEKANPALETLQKKAHELGIWLHLGSIAVKLSEEKLANRSFLISPEGKIAARYDKIHMFDADLPGEARYHESGQFQPGETAIVADLPWGKLGFAICYDLRFPTLFRTLAQAGSKFIAVPAAFTAQTGKAHWESLVRARAIENSCWILAAAQAGKHESGRETHGHSLVVSPWGEILAEAEGAGPELIFADVDTSAVDEARRLLPSLRHDRAFTLG